MNPSKQTQQTPVACCVLYVQISSRPSIPLPAKSQKIIRKQPLHRQRLIVELLLTLKRLW